MELYTKEVSELKKSRLYSNFYKVIPIEKKKKKKSKGCLLTNLLNFSSSIVISHIEEANMVVLSKTSHPLNCSYLSTWSARNMRI